MIQRNNRAVRYVLPEEKDVPRDSVVWRAFEMEKRRRQHPRSVENWYYINRLREIKRCLIPGNVLDVGSAEGLFSCELALEGWQVMALDIHSQLIRYLYQKTALNQLPISCAQADATALPIPDRAFDNIILGEILEHQVSPRTVLYEAGRVLRPGGRLIVTTPVYPYFAQRSFLQWERSDVFVEGAPEDKSPDRHVFEFTPEELKSLANTLGFDLVSFAFVGTRLWKSRLRTFKERIPLPDGLLRLVDRLLIWLNEHLGISISRMPRLLRIHQMVIVLSRR